jgi:hypothetical protein
MTSYNSNDTKPGQFYCNYMLYEGKHIALSCSKSNFYFHDFLINLAHISSAKQQQHFSSNREEHVQQSDELIELIVFLNSSKPVSIFDVDPQFDNFLDYSKLIRDELIE